MKKYLSGKFADIIGISSSLLCLAHCLAVPALMLIGAEFITLPAFKYIFIAASFFAVLVASRHAYRNNLKVMLWVSFSGFSIVMLLEEYIEWMHYAGYPFSIMIIIGHVVNLKVRRHKHSLPERI